MPTTRLNIDGLWRALCPSFDAVLLSRRSTSLRIRPYVKSMLPSVHKSSPTHLFHSSIAQQGRRGVRAHRNSTNVGSALPLIYGVEKEYKSLDEVPVIELHDSLRQLRISKGPYTKIANLVGYLIGVRGEKPSLIHYDALIFANADPEKGSAEVVGKLIMEMKQEGIVPDSGFYHSALHALAVHPDYILRSMLLQEMKERWLEPTKDGWHYIIVGLLRDRQYEIALEKLDEMQHAGIKVHSWLYDVFIYIFCEAGELDEALRILKYRVENGDLDISSNIWYHALDACSSDYYYEGTAYIWQRRVSLGYLNPSDGMCTNVLNTAARFGDAHLATDVVRLITKRASKLDIHHYEALLEAYIGSKDIRSALRILTIMKKAHLEPQEGTVRPIYTYLCSAQHLPSEALRILKGLKKAREPIPIAAVNCILEALIYHGKLDEAIRQYKSLHVLCSGGPSRGTFNTLLQGCSGGDKKDLAMFLASEIVATGVRPDALTYDRLILVCIDQDEYEDAFRYLDEMGEMIEDLRPGTWSAIVRKCVANKDSRAWHVLGKMKARGHLTQKLQKWAYEEWTSDGSELKLEELETYQNGSELSVERQETPQYGSEFEGEDEEALMAAKIT